jgi:hypothetical protein
MKFLLTILTFLALNAGAQPARRSHISIDTRNESLENVLEELSRLSGYAMAYSDDVVPTDARVSIYAESEPLEVVLAKALKDLPVTFKITSSRIILRKKPPPLHSSVRGVITNMVGNPLPGATVVIEGSDPLRGTTSDGEGRFHLSEVPVGRVSLQISSVGYTGVNYRDLLLGTGKELILHVRLEESVTAMDGIEVHDQHDVGFFTGVRSSDKTFPIEEARRFAGTFGDPARMVSSYAGVTSASDESNALIVRGNSPRGVLWRINGIEVPNPNHFASEGASSGVISVLSPNVIDQTTFLKGAFPAWYGNALSAVLDLNLRKGNANRAEHSLQFGTLGVEASTEGPWSSRKKSSYLFNYRYSTLKILDQAGVTLSEIGRYSDYQDGTFNVSFPSGEKGFINVFGIGGSSQSVKPVEHGDDIDLSRVGIGGISYDYRLNTKTSLASGLSLSGTQIRNNRDVVRPGVGTMDLDENYKKGFIRSFLNVQHQSDVLILQGGAVATRLSYDFYLRNLDPSNPVYEEIINFEEQGHAFIWQGFVSARHKVITDNLTLLYGMHYLHFTLTDDASLEPRATLQWNKNNRHTFVLQFGRHSRVENLQYYLARDHQPGGNELQINKDLGFTRSNHFGISHHLTIGAATLSTELYYQRLYNAPVQTDLAAIYSAMNEDSGFITDTLANKGNGRNYGLELSFERPLVNGYYFLCNASIYQSRFSTADEVERNSSYNGSYIAHALAGREITLRNHRLLGFNVKATAGGGRRYTPIDVEASVDAGYQILDRDRAFESRLPTYFRADLQVSYKINKPGYSMEWRLDVQNMTDRRNTAYYYFDAAQNKIRQKLQVGFLPLLSCRIEF